MDGIQSISAPARACLQSAVWRCAGLTPPPSAATPELTQALASALAKQIVAIARRRDRGAFAALYAHFAPRVKAWLMRGGTQPAQAEELAQETLLMVWRKAGLFDPAKAGAATWVFTIARNLQIDARRREHDPQAPSLPLAAEAEAADDAPAHPDALLLVAEQEALLRHALAELPADQAEVVRLSFFQNKPHGEIERELGIPLGTVKSRLRLAMQRLRGALGTLQ